jgi:hypothetical protein
MLSQLSLTNSHLMTRLLYFELSQHQPNEFFVRMNLIIWVHSHKGVEHKNKHTKFYTHARIRQASIKEREKCLEKRDIIINIIYFYVFLIKMDLILKYS